MLTACLDTSTSEASFNLFDQEKKLVSFSRDCRRGASKLLPSISEEIASAGFSVNDVLRWYVGKGPGSFTGIRVGIAFVKGICIASGAAYMGVNSGLAYLSALQEENEVTVLHDGRKNEVICNSFLNVSGLWTEKAVKVLRVEDLRPELFSGALVSLMPAEIFPEGIRDDIHHLSIIDSSMLRKSCENFPQSESGMEGTCRPIYVRPPVFVKPANKV